MKKMSSGPKMKISGREAHIILCALDPYLDTDIQGKIKFVPLGYTKQGLQDLRDRLFAIHEHPEEET